VKGEGSDFASAEQDWSCLFSPVQVYNIWLIVW
jgi:hypothetical protein